MITHHPIFFGHAPNIFSDHSSNRESLMRVDPVGRLSCWSSNEMRVVEDRVENVPVAEQIESVLSEKKLACGQVFLFDDPQATVEIVFRGFPLGDEALPRPRHDIRLEPQSDHRCVAGPGNRPTVEDQSIFFRSQLDQPPVQLGIDVARCSGLPDALLVVEPRSTGIGLNPEQVQQDLRR
jgi:hypothetical protein